TIKPGTNRLSVELLCPELAPTHLVLSFALHAGWLVAEITEPGWLERLSPEEAQTLTAALAGLYKMAGVDLVREQIQACLGERPRTYALAEEGLIVWSPAKAEFVYNLRDGQLIQARTPAGEETDQLPPCPADRLLFQNVPVTWERWVETWEHDQQGK